MADALLVTASPSARHEDPQLTKSAHQGRPNVVDHDDCPTLVA